MANKTKVTDELIIAALVSHRTIKDAAQSVGVTERTIYSRMRDAEFEQLYNCAKTDILRGAVSEVSTQVQDALDVVCNVMHDPKASPQVRLNAAAMILTYSEKAKNRLKAEEIATMPRAPLEKSLMLEL